MKKLTYFLVAVLAAATVFSMVANIETASATEGCYFEFTKSTDKAQVVVGDEIIYAIHLKNVGTSDCTGGGVELKEFYDSKTTFDSASLTPTSGNSVWNFGTIAPGQEYNFLIKVKVNSSVSAGDVIVNKACVWAEQFGGYSDSSVWICRTAQSTVTTGGGPTVTMATTGGGGGGPNGANIPKITLRKSTANSIAYPGQTISYTLTVSSTGTKNADDVSVEDKLPAGFTFADTNTSTKTFNLGNIPNGTDKSVIYYVKVAASTVPGVYENVAVASMNDGFAPDNRSEARATVTVQPGSASMNLAKLIVVKSAMSSTVLAGKTVSYSVIVKNMGELEAVNVTLKDVLPAGFTFVDTNTSEQAFSLGNLAVNDSQTISYTVKASATLASGRYRNTAYVKSDNTSEVSATTDVTVEDSKYVGVTELPKTGMNPLELVFSLAGALIILGLSVRMFLLRRRWSSSR